MAIEGPRFLVDTTPGAATALSGERSKALRRFQAKANWLDSRLLNTQKHPWYNRIFNFIPFAAGFSAMLGWTLSWVPQGFALQLMEKFGVGYVSLAAGVGFSLLAYGARALLAKSKRSSAAKWFCRLVDCLNREGDPEQRARLYEQIVAIRNQVAGIVGPGFYRGEPSAGQLFNAAVRARENGPGALALFTEAGGGTAAEEVKTEALPKPAPPAGGEEPVLSGESILAKLNAPHPAVRTEGLEEMVRGGEIGPGERLERVADALERGETLRQAVAPNPQAVADALAKLGEDQPDWRPEVSAALDLLFSQVFTAQYILPQAEKALEQLSRRKGLSLPTKRALDNILAALKREKRLCGGLLDAAALERVFGPHQEFLAGLEQSLGVEKEIRTAIGELRQTLGFCDPAVPAEEAPPPAVWEPAQLFRALAGRAESGRPIEIKAPPALETKGQALAANGSPEERKLAARMKWVLDYCKEITPAGGGGQAPAAGGAATAAAAATRPKRGK